MERTGVQVETGKSQGARSSSSGLLQRQCACGTHTMGGGQCAECQKKKMGVGRRPLQTKLAISEPGDVYEQEADRVTEQVMLGPVPSSVKSILPRIQRFSGHSAGQVDLAPASVGRIPASSGRPLDPVFRQDMEQRFGHDFSQVRIHADSNADQRTRLQQAHAVTLGNDIFFRHGAYLPETSDGRWLVAHELTHVVQANGPHRFQAFSEHGNENNGETLEREANFCASQAIRGKSVAVRHRAPSLPQAFPACRSILDAREEQVVAEADVQAELALRLASAGPVEREFPIPEGSFGAYRTDDPRRPSVVRPHVVGGRAGRGAADLAVLRGQELEVAEVKRGTWTLITDAELQLENYVQRANQNIPFIEQRWAQRRGGSASITSVRAMPRSRLPLTSPLRVAGIPTTTSWCRDGLVAFKSIGGQDPRIFVCGSMLQSPDQFVEPLVSGAEVAVDRFIDGQLVPRIDGAIQSITVREALRRMLADPTLNQMLQQQLGPVAGVVSQLGGQAADALVDPIERLLHGQADRVIRIAIQMMKDRVVAEVRRILKQQIRQTLQTILNALCATAAQVTAEEVLRELERRMSQLVAQVIPVAVVAVVLAVAAELAAAVGEALLEALKYIGIAVGIVIAAIALWEVAAAIAAGAALAEIAAAVGAFFTQLARALWPLVFA